MFFYSLKKILSSLTNKRHEFPYNLCRMLQPQSGPLSLNRAWSVFKPLWIYLLLSYCRHCPEGSRPMDNKISISLESEILLNAKRCISEFPCIVTIHQIRRFVQKKKWAPERNAC